MAAEESNTNETPMEEEPSTTTLTPGSSSPSPSANEVVLDKDEALKQALNCLQIGKRHLLVKDIAKATASLGESCQLLTEANGPLCADNAEAHFYYGKALLEQSRLELAVFESGPSVENECSEEDNDDEVEDNDVEESDEAGQQEDNENEAEAEPQSSPEEKQLTAAENSENITQADEKKEEDLNSPSPSAIQDSEKPSTSSGSGGNPITNGEKEVEEELSNLELAWEVLEVAKIGYTNQLQLVNNQFAETSGDEEKARLSKSKKHLQKRLSETHSLLGEVATESENYSQAVEDFKTGIKILSDIESPDSREIAQYYFQMGLAYSFGKSFQQAIESFEKSKEIIQIRINYLTSKIENKQTAKDLGIELEDANYTEEVEIAELKAVLPELDEKISDTIDAERENKATIEEEVKEQEVAFKSLSPLKNPNPPAANDISHLVKKKKKADDDDVPPEAPPAKRVCNEPDASTSKKEEVTSSNGHHDS